MCRGGRSDCSDGFRRWPRNSPPPGAQKWRARRYTSRRKYLPSGRPPRAATSTASASSSSTWSPASIRYAAQRFAAIREAHAEKRRVWLRDVRPDLARPFVEVVERALAFDPDERYASAGAMERALMTVVASTPPVIEAGPEPHVAAPAPARRRTSLAWRMSIVAATVAIATAALFMPAAWRERVMGSGGGGGPANPSEAAAIAKHASPALRQIRLPDYSVIGAPSADDRLF